VQRDQAMARRNAGQRSKEDRLEPGKDRRICADAKREREYGYNREARVISESNKPAKRPTPVAAESSESRQLFQLARAFTADLQFAAIV
jgi:hypothetical protein